MSDSLALDFDEWEKHAAWWDSESEEARRRLHVDEDQLAEAKTAFGKIGSSSVGAAYADALQARREAGEKFGAYARGMAAHIRRDLKSYGDTEGANQRALST